MSWPVKTIRFNFYLLLIFVPLIVLPSTSELFEFNKMIVTYLLTTVIAAAWIAEMILQKRFIFKRTLLDLPLLIFLVTQLLSLLFSIDIRSSFLGYYSRFNGGFVSWICYALLYWAFVTFMDKKSALRAIYWTLVTSAVVSVWGFLEHLGVDKTWWVQTVQFRVFSTLGQPNWLAAYLVALIFIPISQTLAAKNIKKLLFPVSMALLLFLVLIFTKSRSGLLAFGISSVVFWGLYFLSLGQLEIRSIRNFIFFGILTLTLTLTINNPVQDLVFHRAPPPPPPGQTEGPALEVGGSESGDIRKIVWTGATRIWLSSAKNFWIGSGPETFAMAYYQFRPVEHNHTSEWELLYNKAHNEFLNYLSTTGILGLGSYLILLGTIIWIFVKSIKKVQLLNDQMLKFALLSGWLSISLTNFWGFSVVILQIFLLLFPALAIALNTDPSPPQKPKEITKAQLFSILLISFSPALLLFYFIFRYWIADIHYASGQKYLRAFSVTQDSSYLLSAYDEYTQAYQLNGSDPPISSDLGKVTAYLSVFTADRNATASANFLQVALITSGQAVAQSPHHPNYYKSRSQVLTILGTVDPKYLVMALDTLKQAQKISPTDPRIPYNMGVLAKYIGNYSEAKSYFDQSLNLKPDFNDPKVQLQQIATASATNR